MNNYFVLHHLTIFLRERCVENIFQLSISPYKDVWTAYIGTSDKPFNLTLSTHPSETALFAEDYKPAKKSNVTSFFDQLTQKRVTDLTLSEQDRFIHIFLQDDYKLLLQLFGNKPNIFLIKENKILESFKNPEAFRGENPPVPRLLTSDTKIANDGLSPKKIITGIQPKFPRHLMPYVIDHYSLDKKNSDDIHDVIEQLTNAMVTNPEFRVLEDGNLCLIPESLLPVDSLKKFDDINCAIKYVFYNTTRQRRLNSKVQHIRPSLEKRIQSVMSLMDKLDDAEKSLERAEKYEQYGHILMANAHTNSGNHETTVTLPNYYNNDKPVEIAIKPDLSIAENAQLYYDKSAKAIRNIEESKRRLKESEKQLSRLKTLSDSLDKVQKIYEFNDWFKEHVEELRELGVLSKSSNDYSTPYRKVKIDDYEVWIGKNAKSNDRVTSDSHKEDIWMHARGVNGSHLVIRMHNNKGMPPKQLLLKAASVAAFHSKARGSGLVPVIITKRKYITKPKGAPLGSVRVDKELVEMVQPLNLTE